MKNKKVIVFCNVAGNINAIKELQNIIKSENINLVVSLGNALGLHDKINECYELIKNFTLIKYTYENILINSLLPEFMPKIKKIILQINIHTLESK